MGVRREKWTGNLGRRSLVLPRYRRAAPPDPRRRGRRVVAKRQRPAAQPVRAKTKPKAQPAARKKRGAAKAKQKAGRVASVRKPRAAGKLRPSPRKKKAKSA